MERNESRSAGRQRSVFAGEGGRGISWPDDSACAQLTDTGLLDGIGVLAF